MSVKFAAGKRARCEAARYETAQASVVGSTHSCPILPNPPALVWIHQKARSSARQYRGPRLPWGDPPRFWKNRLLGFEPDVCCRGDPSRGGRDNWHV